MSALILGETFLIFCVFGTQSVPIFLSFPVTIEVGVV
jgi:hypothetical protein